MSNKTAVTWLIERYFSSDDPLNYGHITQALLMERQQIIDAVDGFPLKNRDLDGEQYYLETYVNKIS